MKFKINKSTTDLEAFRIIIDKNEAKIVSAVGDWVQIFRKNTREYGVLGMLVAENKKDDLLLLSESLFMSRLIFQDVQLITGFMEAVQESTKRILAEIELESNTQSDDEILAEVKVLHEKTEESINELQKIKNEKK